MEGSIRGLHSLELEFLNTVLDILEWGRKIFRDVPRYISCCYQKTAEPIVSERNVVPCLT